MANQQLIDYINQEVKLGTHQEKIESDLVTAGWQSPDVTEAFKSLKTPVISNKKPINLKKILLISGLVLAGLALVGGGVLAYNAYFYSPEKNIERMFNNLSNIKTMAYSGELKVSANVPETLVSAKKLSNLSLTFDGASDTQNFDDIRGLFSFQIKTDAVSGLELSLGLEMRSLSKMLFLKLSNLPNLGFIDLGALSDKWIKLDESMISQNNAGSLSEKYKNIDSNLVKEKAIKLKNLFVSDKVITISETLKKENINGQDTYHYKYIINKEALKKFSAEAALLMTDKALTAQEIASSSEQIDKIDLSEGELWIGKKDFMPYKLSFNAKAKDETNPSAENQINLVLFFKNFNQPVKIEAPADAKTVTELMSSLMGGMLSNSGDSMFGDDSMSDATTTVGVGSSLAFSSEDLKLMDTDSDNDGLSDYEEINIHKTSPNNSDTDGDGFSDRQEVKGGYNPLGEGKLDAQSLAARDNLEIEIYTKAISNNGSVGSLSIVGTLESARIKARDARRISDIRQIQTALEMYYNDMNFYPSVKEFSLKSIRAGSSTYMQAIPEAPLPVDGACADKDGSNRYTYKTDSKGATSSTYTLTYCLGNNVGGINASAGVNTASEKGIK